MHGQQNIKKKSHTKILHNATICIDPLGGRGEGAELVNHENETWLGLPWHMLRRNG